LDVDQPRISLLEREDGLEPGEARLGVNVDMCPQRRRSIGRKPFDELAAARLDGERTVRRNARSAAIRLAIVAPGICGMNGSPSAFVEMDMTSTSPATAIGRRRRSVPSARHCRLFPPQLGDTPVDDAQLGGGAVRRARVRHDERRGVNS